MHDLKCFAFNLYTQNLFPSAVTIVSLLWTTALHAIVNC